MRLAIVLCCALLFSFPSHADGPADRRPTDPHTVTSESRPVSAPLPVEALLTTNRVSGITHSHDGHSLAYISTASGRPNLWIMSVDGSGAQQLVTNNDRQTGARFTPDDSALGMARIAAATNTTTSMLCLRAEVSPAT